MPSMSRKIGKSTPLHARLVARLASRIKMAERQQYRQHDKWRKAEEAVLAYIPETEADAVRRAKRDRGQPTYTTIVVPYTYGMLMTAHTYLTSVFLGRSPIHQFVGRHGEAEEQIMAMEALIGYQTDVGGLTGPYMVWIYDALKYGLGILGEYWDDETIQYGRVQEILDPRTGKPIRVQSSQRVPGYSGHKLYNISPFDWMHDPRVSVGNFQKGEFVVVRRVIMWNEIVRRARQGYYSEDVREIKTSGRFGPEHHDGGSALLRPEDQQLEDTGDNGDRVGHPAVVRAYEVYVDLIPSEWGLGDSDFPEKWCFTITADKMLVFGATPLGMIHGQFPFTVAEPEIEAYGEYNRGLPQVMEGIQQTMDWLLNSHFWNVRQTMNNQFIIDPSRVVMKDVEGGGPGFVWRLRPEAYGQDPSGAVTQVQVQDLTQSHINDIQSVFALGERTLGVNEQMMGAPPPGGRVTATASRISTGFGVNRLKTIAEYISAQAFLPHSHRMVKTTQQYYDSSMKLRIVGDLVRTAGPSFLMVTPETISGSYTFVPVDGTLPVDRFAQATLWKDLFAQVGRMPQVAMRYDLSKVFAWVAQLSGLRNIHKMEIQMADPAAIAAAQQAGNLVPIGGPGGSGSMAGGPTSLPAPGSPQDTGAY